jgi:hypothetical protein
LAKHVRLREEAQAKARKLQEQQNAMNAMMQQRFAYYDQPLMVSFLVGKNNINFIHLVTSYLHMRALAGHGRIRYLVFTWYTYF